MTGNDEEFTNIGVENGHYEERYSCAAHMDLEIRIAIIERDMGEMRGELRGIKTDISSISHDLKNMRQCHIGTLKSLDGLAEANTTILMEMRESEQRGSMQLNELQKRHHWEFMWIIRALIVLLGAIVISGGSSILKFI